MASTHRLGLSRFIAIVVIAVTVGAAPSVASAQSSLPASPRAYGLGAPFSVTDLPSSRLREDLEALAPETRVRALARLHEFSFPAADVNSLRVDSDGGIFYEDHFDLGSGGGGATMPPSVDAAPDVGATLDSFTASLISNNVNNALMLHSRPGASRVVYLNFLGQEIKGTAWNNASGRSTLYALPFSLDETLDALSLEEAFAIAEIWKQVAEDYAPYDVDVTTEKPPAFGPRVGHVLITRQRDSLGYLLHNCACGGAAYVNVWGATNFTYYQPALVFYEALSKIPRWIADASSHELGHNLGLSHDGSPTSEYYPGHGSGLTSWAPIMGVSYYRNVTQWSKGEYSGANNKQDDLAIIGGKLTSLADDHHDVLAMATPLVVSGGSVASRTSLTDFHDSNGLYRERNNRGIVNSSADVDVFVVEARSAGTFDLTVTPAWRDPFTVNTTRGANLDVHVSLLDSAGGLVAESNPISETNARLVSSVGTGRYYLSIRGAGVGTPATGYSNYASVGQYFITGTTPPSPRPQSVGFDLNEMAVSEDVGILKIPVRRLGGTLGRISVPYQAASMNYFSRFSPVAGTIDLGPGTLSGEISIPIPNDTVYSGPQSEWIFIELGEPTGAVFGDLHRSVSIKVLDDEKGIGFVPSHGQDIAGKSAYALQLASVSEGDGAVTITVGRRGSSGAASVNYSTANGTAVAGADFATRTGTLRWVDGDSSPKTLTVPILEDTAHEGDEWFSVKLSNAVGAALLSSDEGRVHIVENDPPAVLKAQIETLTVSENVGSFTLVFTRSGRLDNTVTAKWSTICWTACAPSDYVAGAGTLTFAPGQTTASVVIRVVDDIVPEADEKFSVGLFDVVGGITEVPFGTLVTIRDNDGPNGGPALQISGLSLSASSVSGCGKSVAGVVSLTGPAPPTGLTVTLSDTLNAGNAPNSITFPAGATSASFTFLISPVSQAETGNVTATLGDSSASQSLTIRPISIKSLSLKPTTAVGSTSVAGSVIAECSAKPGPITVTLMSDNPGVARPVATSVVIPQGSKSASFDVMTDVVTTRATANLIAVAGDSKLSRTLTVTPAVAVSPASLKFGTVVVNSAGATLSATVSNKGAVPFSILDVALTGTGSSQFTRTSSCPPVLPGGSSCTIDVKFRPTSTGTKSAKLAVRTSASTSTSVVSLSGSGAASL